MHRPEDDIPENTSGDKMSDEVRRKYKKLFQVAVDINNERTLLSLVLESCGYTKEETSRAMHLWDILIRDKDITQPSDISLGDFGLIRRICTNSQVIEMVGMHENLSVPETSQTILDHFMYELWDYATFFPIDNLRSSYVHDEDMTAIRAHESQGSIQLVDTLDQHKGAMLQVIYHGKTYWVIDTRGEL